jgi:hypothetical protein
MLQFPEELNVSIFVPINRKVSKVLVIIKQTYNFSKYVKILSMILLSILTAQAEKIKRESSVCI